MQCIALDGKNCCINTSVMMTTMIRRKLQKFAYRIFASIISRRHYYTVPKN